MDSLYQDTGFQTPALNTISVTLICSLHPFLDIHANTWQHADMATVLSIQWYLVLSLEPTALFLDSQVIDLSSSQDFSKRSLGKRQLLLEINIKIPRALLPCPPSLSGLSLLITPTYTWSLHHDFNIWKLIASLLFFNNSEKPFIRYMRVFPMDHQKNTLGFSPLCLL